MANINAADPDLANDYTLVRSASFGSGATLAGTETCAYKAYQKSGTSRKLVSLTVLTAPEDAAGWIALQQDRWNGGGWMDRSSMGLWCNTQNRAGAVFGDDLAKGWLVVFECSQAASNVLTLINDKDEPDGTFTYTVSEDGNSYYCTITADADAYVGFCGVKGQGYINSISVYKPKAVVPEVETYNLYLCGTQVTSDNAADVLGDGAFSYDAESKTLTVSGDATSTVLDYGVIYSGIDGLVINAAADAKLSANPCSAISIRDGSSATLTGNGKLNLLAAQDAAINIEWNCSMAIVDANLAINPYEGIYGRANSKLVIDNSSITIGAITEGSGAVNGIAEFTLKDCSITVPEGGYFSEGKIVDSEGNTAYNVSIVPGGGVTPDVEGNLRICGTQVTNENAADILGDGAFSYDAESKTLHVKGDYDYDGDYLIMNMDIPGLTIAIDKDVTLRCTTSPDFAFWFWESTTITGPGKLTLQGNISIINGNGHVLTFDEANVDLKLCTSKSIMGNFNDEALVVKNSTIHAQAYYWAICDFKGGITIEDSTLDEGLRLSDDGSSIVTASGSEATSVTITSKADGIRGVAASAEKGGVVGSRKVLVDGQLLIVAPDGRTYNLQGISLTR